MNNQEPIIPDNYERDYSHTHCWDNKNNPCGIPLEKHTQCCLCDLTLPNKEVNSSEEKKDKSVLAYEEDIRNGIDMGDKPKSWKDSPEEDIRVEELKDCCKKCKYLSKIRQCTFCNDISCSCHSPVLEEENKTKSFDDSLENTFNRTQEHMEEHKSNCEYIRHCNWHKENNKHLCNCDSLPKEEETKCKMCGKKDCWNMRNTGRVGLGTPNPCCKLVVNPTQEPMEWESDWEELKKEFIAVKQNEWWSSDEDYIKDFIDFQIKQAEERVKKEIEDKCADSFYPYCGGDKEGDISCYDKLQKIIKNI